MIKGCQRKIILMQGEECSPFESACFILRDGDSADGEKDMMREASRIIARALPGKAERLRRREALVAKAKTALVFSLGMLLGALAASVPVLVCSVY